MKRLLYYVTLIPTLFLASCGIFGSSDDDPVTFSVELDRMVLAENATLTVTANNPTATDINLLISRTGDPHLERLTDGDWVRLEEAPPAFAINTFTLEAGNQRNRQISYDYLNQITESPAGEYRVYYNYYIGNQENDIQTEYSDTFEVE